MIKLPSRQNDKVCRTQSHFALIHEYIGKLGTVLQLPLKKYQLKQIMIMPPINERVWFDVSYMKQFYRWP